MLKQQYEGFLGSNSISNSDSFLGVSLFDCRELFKSSSLPDILNLALNDNEVLGKRIEYFFEFCIDTSQNYKVIAKNIQVFKQKITIGELDFLIEDLLNGGLMHIELVYKFYV